MNTKLEAGLDEALEEYFSKEKVSTFSDPHELAEGCEEWLHDLISDYADKVDWDTAFESWREVGG